MKWIIEWENSHKDRQENQLKNQFDLLNMHGESSKIVENFLDQKICSKEKLHEMKISLPVEMLPNH